jgi:hypothetical protein
MAWGTGDDEARVRMRTISRAELESMHMTAEIAEIWRDFYRRVKNANADNPSAEGRAELMERARRLLMGDA